MCVCDVCIWRMFVFMSVVVTVWGSVEMFVVQRPLSVTVIVRLGGAIWLNPFATVLFNLCSAVTV